ncbi:tail sheath protein [Yersinia phage vB_YenM_P778]
MASWIPIVKVNITLNTSGSSREGFGLPLFIAATDAFEERVRGYTSLEDVAEDFAVTEATYKAAQALWSQTPKVTQLYVGRRNLQYILNIAAAPTTNQQYVMTLTGANGAATSYFYTAIAGATAADVFQSFKTDIEADATFNNIVVVTLSGTGAGTAMMVDLKNADTGYAKVTIPSNSDVQMSKTAAENGAAALTRIEKYNDEWYFVTSDDRTTQGVQSLAREVEARTKIFFTASADPLALEGTNIELATDIPAFLANNKMSRTVCLWHQTSGTAFPELAYIAYGAPYDAGSISWGNALLTGTDYSRQPTNNRPLTSTQKAALETRNCNYIDYDGGLNVVRHGKVGSGEWIDIIRGVDWLQYELTTSLRTLLVNQKGGKITYDDTGITRVRQVIESALQRAVTRRFLESFVVTVPRSLDVSIEDKRARILAGVKFTGILSGAINDVTLDGTVAYE